MRLDFPKVSVVVSTFKRPEMLRELMETVLNQTYEDYEVIVVDDGSHTATKALTDISEAFHEKGVRLRVLEMEENSGYQCVPKNIGIFNSEGSYIAHADDDDLWDPRHLEILVDLIERGEADIVYGNYRLEMEGKTVDAEYIPFNWKTLNLIAFGPMTSFITSHTLFSKAAVVAKLAGNVWNEEARRFGDWDLYYRCLVAGLRFKGTPEITYTYRLHPESISMTRPADENEWRADKEPIEWDSSEDSVWRG